MGDAICDRLVHGAHRLTLRGESLRKAKAVLTSRENVDADCERTGLWQE